MNLGDVRSVKKLAVKLVDRSLPEDQERIIQGVGRCVQGATGLLMQISPALGPASPFVYGISLAFNVAAGVMMSITASPGNSSASQSVSQASGFQYDLSGLETKIKQNFQQMGWEFQLTLLSLKRLGTRP